MRHDLRVRTPAASSSSSSTTPRDAKSPGNHESLVALLRDTRRSPTATGTDDDDNQGDDGDTDDAQPVTPASTTTTDDTPRGVKRSRYLREADRRDIIRRIDEGEKQSDLAKEFGVTRAAICHINKNRIEILTRSARSDVHAAARHPKRGMYTTSRSNFYDHDRLTPQLLAVVAGRGELPMVYEVQSLALAIHLTTLRCSDTSERQFRAAADRAFRVLLEEALAAVPTRHVEIVATNGATSHGIAPERPPCAVFMSECGYPILEAFRSIEPDSPTGFMTLDREVAHGRRHVTLRKLCAPTDLRFHNIFLLDATCASAAEACVAIQSLLDFGAHESSIFFATLVISAVAVAELCEKFPRMRIVTAAVDPDVSADGNVRPGVGNFQERYFNTTTIRQSALGANVDL